jgi:hypothetical protein
MEFMEIQGEVVAIKGWAGNTRERLDCDDV